MPSLEEITCEAGRHALSDQEALVAGIRQRTGMLLAAHALVTSFLGAAAVRSSGLNVWAWIAVAALVLGVILAATLLAPWELRFAIDAHRLYDRLYAQAAAEAPSGSQRWLAAAGYSYQALQEANVGKVRSMERLSGLLAVSMVVQTLAWLVDLIL